MADQKAARTSSTPEAGPPLRIAVVPSLRLFRGADLVLIERNRERWQLRITSHGKLILTT
jgi:hemin uptake protein HemP